MNGVSVRDIDRAITEIYDALVTVHRGQTPNVFRLATKKQVAEWLAVTGHEIDLALKGHAPYGFCEYKNRVLAKSGRGKLVAYSASAGGQKYFQPKGQPNA